MIDVIFEGEKYDVTDFKVEQFVNDNGHVRVIGTLTFGPNLVPGIVIEERFQEFARNNRNKSHGLKISAIEITLKGKVHCLFLKLSIHVLQLNDHSRCLILINVNFLMKRGDREKLKRVQTRLEIV